MFFLTLLAGIISCLTPLVFPYIIISSIVFSQISSTKKQHFFKVLIFCALVITLYSISGLYIGDLNFLNVIKTNENITTLIIRISIIIFSLWLIGLYKSNSRVNMLFHWFGLILISLLITISSFSSTGPILGSLLANPTTEDSTILTAFIGFSVGISLFCSIILLLTYRYLDRVKQKNWWNIVTKMTALFLIITSVTQLISL